MNKFHAIIAALLLLATAQSAEAQCRPGEFHCGEGECILQQQKCDGNKDCRNGLDESGCLVRCTDGQFTCSDGTCLPLSRKCDNRRDCPDGSDEHYCPCDPQHQFECSNGICIPRDQRCNGVHNCQDLSDEIGCPIRKCEDHQFQCLDGTCIPNYLHCNLHTDCPDKSDEFNCNNCTTDQYRCNDGTCISLGKKCDGVADCVFSEDEENCALCPSDKFKCDNGDCIDERKRCDRNFDCADGSDEQNCNAHGLQPKCADDEFQCAAGFCIMGYKRCNGIKDCLSGNDEENCPPPPEPPTDTCNDEEIRCADGTCVPGRTCDSTFDCPDQSDERDCPYGCAPDKFSCLQGGCIEEHLRCDGTIHCSDGSDESNCVNSCPGDQFRCSDGVCLQNTRRCDGYADCRDGSDEMHCQGLSQNTSCASNQFECKDRQCLEIEYRCDGYADCRDGDDEENCSQEVPCSGNQFQCYDRSQCVDARSRCDGRADCNDGSDEQDCPNANCASHEFRCGNGDCIPNFMRCNQSPDCPDQSDEMGCRTCHEPEWFQCTDGACVEMNLRCDNFYDCRDFSDEQNCFACSPHQFQCVSNGHCIDGTLRCNRRNDCSDGSDEYNCPNDLPPPVPSTDRPPYVPQPVNCPSNYIPCDNGYKCIQRAQLCDGRVDCHDMSDETKCSSKGDGLMLETTPNAQEIKENIYKPDREVVFSCRDVGPLRARVRWSRPNGMPLPPGSRDLNGRLEIPNIKVEHGGTYYCEAVGYAPDFPGARVSVHLEVNRWIPPPTPPPRPPVCDLHEATCSNGDCIPKSRVCDGKYDCTDGSDESRCNPNGCEPNEFRCSNKKCVLKTWRCDGDNDCGDGSDEENCATNAPGSLCAYHQFACHSNNQCIPKGYQCDLERDCVDGSDEIGCSKPVISKPPPPMVVLAVGQTFEVTCTAVGIPTPEVVWRLNWGHIPQKCRTTSENGVGTISCPDIQIKDQGAYSCEVLNIKGTIFAIPDTILVVNHTTAVCPAGYFNEEAQTESECIKCFCFGQSTNCRSADLFIYNFQAPFDTLKLLGVRVDQRTGNVEIRDEPIYRNARPQLNLIGANGVYSTLPANAELDQNNLVPYFAMSENYHDNQLKSYGGYLRFAVNHQNRGYPTPGPAVIITGNGYTLINQQTPNIQPYSEQQIQVRFFEGEWLSVSPNHMPRTATREEIMMVLADVTNILLKLQYNEGPLNTTITNIEMESAAVPNRGLGPANYVEECECPIGYSGTSCEHCADGYIRHKQGPWLGKCYRDQAPPQECPPGYYGDPARGKACEICPCPLTSPSNQFGRTCSLGSDGSVVCDCPPGYVGRRCEQCAPGFVGNPLIPGDSCRPGQQPTTCSAVGALANVEHENGVCRCKDYVTGPNCDTCQSNTFYLSPDNQFGCIACFCMGITKQCSSSNWYRDQIHTAFVSSQNNFRIIDTLNRDKPITEGIHLNQNEGEISYSSFNSPNVHYWKLPTRYLGNKITSYGGYLRYTVRYVAVPGGQSSRNSAADVELVSANQINLLYFARDQTQPTGSAQTFNVPLLEQYWQRSDGQKADREHLLMALADLEDIYIKATYHTNTRESALISVSLDVADERNTGAAERAYPVEQCYCPQGYRGLSCEDCDVGYTRADAGIYLGICEPCQCNGNSNDCDSETGICTNCNNNTTGDNCEVCLPGFEGDPLRNIPCQHSNSNSQTCACDERGSISTICDYGICRCKSNVEGANCNLCRSGTFSLSPYNPDGCESCFCSGVSRECSESNFFIEQIPSQIISIDNDHGFTLTDEYQRTRISSDFHINPRNNEIGYTFRPGDSGLYWSLPNMFTGNQIRSYGGQLEFTQKYTQRQPARYQPDKDIIIMGNGIMIYWTNPQVLQPNVENKISVAISPISGWQRLDQQTGPRPASREDIMIALANVEAILIRAQPSPETESCYINDIILDTAIETYSVSNQPRATNVEVCRCPVGYRGSSCEACSSGYYRDRNDLRTGPLGSCSRCPCNNNEESCSLGIDNRVVCNCLPGYTGEHCEYKGAVVPPTQPPVNPPRRPEIEVTISAPQIEIYEVGSTVRVNCSAISLQGRQIERIAWSKDGSQLPRHIIDDGRGILLITNIQESDSGRYICQASDGYTWVSNQIVVNVGRYLRTAFNQTASGPRAPSVAIQPAYVDVQEGNRIEIQCAADGNPQPLLQFIRANGQPLNPRHYLRDGVLLIESATKNDEGPYQCIATNSAGSRTAEVEVVVRENSGQLVRVDISPRNYSGYNGETVTLRCLAQSRDSTSLRWSRPNAQLPYNSREENGVLTIEQAKPEDSGRYTCTATSYDGLSGVGHVEVNIANSSPGIYPIAKVTPERTTISEGSTVELNCEASGSPVPTIKWTKYGKEMPPHVEQIGPILRISNAQASDRGVYVCVVSNVHGLEQASTIVEVNRLLAPELSIYPQETQTVTEGNSAILQCRVEKGIPSPTVIWSRPGGLPLSSNIEVMLHGALKFTRITPNEGGQYICSAENEAGRATAIANIQVFTQPEIWTVPQQELVIQRRDSYVKLECHATGTPAPTVQWRRHSFDTRVHPISVASSNQQVRNVAVLEIARFGPQDEGLYICEAQNEAGIAEKRLQLALESIPTRGDIPGEDSTSIDDTNGIRPDYKDNESGKHAIPTERFTAPVGTRAELRCQINSKNDSEHIFVNWARADNASLPSDAFVRGESLYIDNVQPEAAGEYRCIGSHHNGRVVFQLSTYLEVISPPRISLTPQRQVVRPGDNAYIQCSATGQQPIKITWSPMNRDLPASVTTRDGYMQFNNIQLSDAGRYRCTAVNTAGEADAVADVIVEENIRTPVITADNREQTAPIGSTVNLRCRSHDPQSINNIRWFRERYALPVNSRVDGETLHIFNIQREDEGRYYCEIPKDRGSASDYIDLRVSGPTQTVTVPPSLHISPPERTYRSGENVDITCQSSEPGVIATWSKLSGRISNNIQINGGNLRAFSLRAENAGTYRCEATGAQGVYHQDYELNVEEDIHDEPPLQVKTVPQGSSIVLECKTDLSEPVSYLWTKQERNIADDVDIYGRTLQLNDLQSSDAGIYTCKANNGHRSLDVNTVLVVTGIVPHFAQAPTSYIALETLPDAYIQFNFEISFKPQNSDGLILYNGNKQSDPDGDFISLALVNGVPEFRFNLGHSVTTVKADSAVALDKWHTVKVTRHRKKVTMTVDGNGPYIGNADGKYIGLDLSEPLYIGGVPNFGNISPGANAFAGFVGCISRLRIGYNHVDITKKSVDKEGITTCETCSPSPCQNMGICQESLSAEGYSCICPPGFSGPVCNKMKGEACSPYACGSGRCVDTENGFDCLCPLGYSGRRCENQITVTEPAFKDGSYIAYPTLKPQRRFKVSLKVKPNTLNDGILLYASETDEGYGDFVSIAVKNRRIAFSFFVGNKLTTIESANEIQQGEWLALIATKSFSDGRLIVNGQTTSTQSLGGQHKVLNLMTPLYIGGFDKQNIKINNRVGVNNGFDGCISEINVPGAEMDILRNVTDAVNVEQCAEYSTNDVDNNINNEYAHENIPSPPLNSFDNKKTGCSGNPCRNDGTCYPLSPTTYTCSCINGYTGQNCELELNLCDQLAPCQNGGTCNGNTTKYSCDCLLGYSGVNCDERANLRNDAHFDGNGYLEFDKSLLDHAEEMQDEVIAFEISTNTSDGLIFWHGQTANEDGQGQDFISLGIVNGYLEFSYDLGSGPAIIRNSKIRVNDGSRHSVILKRTGTEGSIEIDNEYLETGEAPGITSSMNCQGNIYLGGTPNIPLMTGARFQQGFNGCVHGFELQNSRTLDLGVKAVSGLNVKPCASIFPEEDIVV